MRTHPNSMALGAATAVAGIAAICALAQWDPGAWPSAEYPRRGAAHTTNTLDAYRERHCASQADFWSDVVWGPGADAYFGVGWAAQWTNYPEVVWGKSEMLYRMQRDNLIRLKTAITNALPWYVDIGRTNDTTLYSFTQYLQAHNRLPMLTLDRMQVLLYEKQGLTLADGYWTNTPLRGLSVSEYGWGPMTNIFALLVCTTGQVSWVEALACETTNVYDWGDAVVVTSVVENAVAGPLAGILPWDRYAWWDADFPGEGWPVVALGTGACTPYTNAAAEAPSWIGAVANNIAFERDIYYVDEFGAGSWDIDGGVVGNTQNTYRVTQRGVSARPAVTNCCAMMQRRADFYIMGSTTTTWANAGVWFLHDQTAETGNDAVVGDRLDPTAVIPAHVVTNQYGDTYQYQCWGPTNEVPWEGMTLGCSVDTPDYPAEMGCDDGFATTWTTVEDCAPGTGVRWSIDDITLTRYWDIYESTATTNRTWSVQRSAAAIWWDGPNGMKFK